MANQHTAWRPDAGRIRELYDAGQTQAEVATILGVSQKMVWRAMRTLGIGARVAAKREQRGPKNSSWKKDGLTYSALHYRVIALRGQPKKCERCHTMNARKTYDWANLSGRYDDPSDYERMCRSCHRQYDNGRRNADR